MDCLAAINDIGPRGMVIGMFVLCGLFLLGSVCTSTATGEMSEGRDNSSGRRIVYRDQEPRRFAFMLGTCVFGAVVCFASAGYVGLFM